MLSAIACWLFGLLGDSQILWWLFQVLVVCLFLYAVSWLDCRIRGGDPPKPMAVLLFGLVVATLILMWVPNLPRSELNPDESQWIAQANNFAADPSFWWNYFLPVNLTRLFTVLPLGVVSLFAGGHIGYEATRIATILMWTSVVVCSYCGTRNIFGQRAALWSSALLVVVLGFFSIADFVAYNSELPVILLCLAAYALMSRAAALKSGIFSPALTGFVVAAIPFAKDQGAPLAVVFGAGGFALFTLRRQWTKLAAFTVGGMALVFLVFLILVATRNWHEWLDVLRVVRDYATVGAFGDGKKMGVSGRILILLEMLLRQEMRFLVLCAAAAVPLLLVGRWLNLWRPTGVQAGVCCWAAILFAATSFAVAYPGQNFPHYGLLLIVPCSIALGPTLDFLLRHDGSEARPWVLATAFLLLLVGLLNPARAHDGVTRLPGCCSASPQNVVSTEIMRLANEGDRMMIWGWANSYFVATGLLQGSRWMYPQFAVGPFPSRERTVKFYTDDIDYLRPKIILEWVGADAFHFVDAEAARMENIPEIASRLQADYELAAVHGNQRIFRRKQR